MNKFIKNIYKFRTFTYSIICVLILVSFVLMNLTNDGMNNDKNIKLYYKTYSNKWTLWSRDGLTSGNKVNNISNIKFKIRCKNKCSIKYKYSNNKLDVKIDKKLSKKYIFCYRTYNKKWNNWICDKSSNLGKFSAFEAKIIPKNVEKSDWLRK